MMFAPFPSPPSTIPPFAETDTCPRVANGSFAVLSANLRFNTGHLSFAVSIDQNGPATGRVNVYVLP